MVKIKQRNLDSRECLLAILFTVFTIASAIAVIIIAVCKFQYNYITLICNLILIKSYLISLFFLFYLILNSKSTRLSYNQQQQVMRRQHQQQQLRSTNNQILLRLVTKFVEESLARESNLAIYVFITILGVGDAIFNLTRSIDQLFAILSLDHKNERLFLILSFSENFLKLLYQLFLLFFIIYHKDFIDMLYSRSWLKWFIGYLSILCLIQWVLIILQEIFNEYDIKTVSFYRLTSVNLTSFKNYEAFLYPLGIEFRICCFIELLFLFLSSFYWVYGKCIVNLPTNNSHEDSQIVNFFESKVLNSMVSEEKSHITKNSEFFILMGFSIFLFSLTIIVILFQYNNIETNMDVVIRIHEICDLIVIMFLLTLFLFPISCVKNTHKNSIQREFNFIMQPERKISTVSQMIYFNKCEIMKKIDFIFLYISLASLSAHCLLIIFGDVIIILGLSETRKMDLNALTLITSALTIFQAVVQLKKMMSYKTRGNLNKKFMNITILMNLTVWMLETFSDKSLAKSQIKIKSFGVNTFEYFTPIFLPLAKFFRFHSCIVLIKIKYEKYLVKYDRHEELISF